MSTSSHGSSAIERSQPATSCVETNSGRASRSIRSARPLLTETMVRRSPADPLTRVVFLHGELDADNAPDLEDALDGLLGSAARSVVFDLSDVSFVDCSIVGYLARLRSRFDRSGQTLTVQDPTPTVRRTLQLTGMLELLGPANAEEASPVGALAHPSAP